MNRNELINEGYNYIKQCELVKCLLVEENINNGNDLIINLYVYTNESDYSIVLSHIHKYFYSHQGLLLDKHNNYKSSYYYETKLNININYVFNFNITSLNNIICLHDPYDLYKHFIVLPLTFKKSEFIAKLNELSIKIYDFYNSYQLNDQILYYKKALEIQECYVYIYRAFYDSINAKKGYNDLYNISQDKYFEYLYELIKYFDYDGCLEGVKIIIKDIDKMISNLSITMLSSFKLDFYNFVKDLILNF